MNCSSPVANLIIQIYKGRVADHGALMDRRQTIPVPMWKSMQQAAEASNDDRAMDVKVGVKTSKGDAESLALALKCQTHQA